MVYIILFFFIFKNRGFSIDGLIGIDISSNMLQKAKERKCYSSLIWEDVLKPLQFHENSFDYIICVGTTTYLGNVSHMIQGLSLGRELTGNMV